MLVTRRKAIMTGAALAASPLLPRTLYAQDKLASLAFGPSTAVYAIGMIADLKGYFRDEGVTLKLMTGNAAPSAVRRWRPGR